MRAGAREYDLLPAPRWALVWTSPVHALRGPLTWLITRLFLVIACAQTGEMALMMASGHGHVEVVRALLAAGADKEAKDKVGGGVCRKI